MTSKLDKCLIPLMRKKTTITVTHLLIVHIHQGCLTGCRADAGHLAILCSNRCDKVGNRDADQIQLGNQYRYKHIPTCSHYC